MGPCIRVHNVAVIDSVMQVQITIVGIRGSPGVCVVVDMGGDCL